MKQFEKEAIALEYGQQESPTLLAKGSRELAFEIIEEAKKHDIFIAEDHGFSGAPIGSAWVSHSTTRVPSPSTDMSSRAQKMCYEDMPRACARARVSA